MSEPLLQVRDLCTHFHTRDGVVRAVDGVSFELRAGETLALVGESGSGKSVTSLSILRLIASPPGRIVGGSIRFQGRDLLALSADGMRGVRGREISMIFQEPMTSLNPVYSCGEQIAEVVRLHERADHATARARAIEMLRLVGIPSPEQRVDEYPHQLSGGMRQRVMIAMALACRPAMLIADEPTTALDVTIQAQILELLARLQRELGMAVLLITHDLGVVAEAADRVAVMYAGQVVEAATVEAAFARPLHPYTAGLLASRPRLGQTRERLLTIPGQVPDPARFPPGCRFHPRCPLARGALPRTGAGARARARPHQPLLARRRDRGRGRATVRGRGRPWLSRCSRYGTQQALPGPPRRVRPGGGAGARGRRRVLRAAARARRSAWWARAAAARPPPAGCILRLIEPTSGSVRFEGEEVTTLARRALRAHAPAHADRLPGSVLEPQPAPDGGQHDRRAARHPRPRDAARRRASAWRSCSPASGSRPTTRSATRTSSRAASASASASRARWRWSPRLIVADEPVSALDVSIQAQIVNLLRDLQREMGLALPVRGARPVGGRAHQRPRRGDVPGADRRAAAARERSTPPRCIRTRARCCRRCRWPIRHTAGSAVVPAATCRVPPARRRAATSIRAARRRGALLPTESPAAARGPPGALGGLPSSPSGLEATAGPRRRSPRRRLSAAARIPPALLTRAGWARPASPSRGPLRRARPRGHRGRRGRPQAIARFGSRPRPAGPARPAIGSGTALALRDRCDRRGETGRGGGGECRVSAGGAARRSKA